MTTEAETTKLDEIYRMLKDAEDEKKRKQRTQTIPVEQFLDDPTVEPTTRYNRKLSLGRFCESLGKEIESPNPVRNRRYKTIIDREKVVRASNEIAEDIRAGKLTSTEAVKTFLAFCKNKEFSPYMIGGWRRQVIAYFKSVLGDDYVSESALKRNASAGQVYSLTTKKASSP